LYASDEINDDLRELICVGARLELKKKASAGDDYAATQRLDECALARPHEEVLRETVLNKYGGNMAGITLSELPLKDGSRCEEAAPQITNQ